MGGNLPVDRGDPGKKSKHQSITSCDIPPFISYCNYLHQIVNQAKEQRLDQVPLLAVQESRPIQPVIEYPQHPQVLGPGLNTPCEGDHRLLINK
jgi:hypothetical protein